MAFLSEEGLEYKLLTQDRVDEALKVQTETMRQENIALGVGMFEEPGAPEEMSLVFREVVKEGATLVAMDQATGDLAAVAFNRIHARPRDGEPDELQTFMEKNLKHRSCRELVKFLDYIESSVNIFERYNADVVMELFYLGTNPRFQGRGIGRQMVRKCIEFGRGLWNGSMKRIIVDGVPVRHDVRPQLIYGVFASNYSQSIADKFGFGCLHEVRYEDYVSAGRRMSEGIGPAHRTARLQALEF